MAKNGSLLTGIRLFAFLTYGYSIYFQQVTKNPYNVHRIGKLKFLTYWDLLLQFSFFTLVLFSQSLLKIRSKSLTKFIDVMFYSLVLPVSMIVAITFWGLYAIDREIIFPRFLEPYYPNWLNHSTHTLVVILPFVELFLSNYKSPSNKLGLTVLQTFMVSYLLLVLYLALVDDLWVYPFLNILNWPQRIGFFVASFTGNCIFYYVGIYLGGLASNKQNSRKQKHK